MKNTNKWPRFGLFASALALCSMSAQAQTLFQDNFDSNSTANWSVYTTASGSHAANIFFDYSTLGIPTAPNSSGGSTIGAKLEANYGTTGAVGGVSISPTGQSFTGNYVLKYDIWQNFNGALPAKGATDPQDGGSGSTQWTGAGIGASGTALQVNNSTINSVLFNTTGDAGNGIDYRVYTSTGLLPAGSTNYAATGTDNRSAANAYYSQFGGITAPSAQTALYPQQTGLTLAGAQGWAWHEAEIRVIDGVASWYIDNLLIATVDTSGLTLGGNNIVFNQYDGSSGISSDPNRRDLLFGVIDNVRVEAVPEPSTLALSMVGVAGAFFAIRRRK